MLDEVCAESLKIEHGADVWFGAARPARLKTDQKLRYGLIKRKRRTRCYGRLLEIEHDFRPWHEAAERECLLYSRYRGRPDMMRTAQFGRELTQTRQET